MGSKGKSLKTCGPVLYNKAVFLLFPEKVGLYGGIFRSEDNTSEHQSDSVSSYAVFGLKIKRA